jgi:divalent metal cation (Fe/Co/Zn/Cd) transporter
MAHLERDTASREPHLLHAVRVSQLSVAWNVAAGSAGAVVGLVTGSLALVGFGLDAIVDAAASAVLVHRFHVERRDPHRAEELERRARRILGTVLVAIGVYIGASAVNELASHHSPDKTTAGVLIALASLVVLPPLAFYKRRIASALGSTALRADSVLTIIAAALAAGALLGLILTDSFGWWWADSTIALVMAGVLLREGFGVLRGPPARTM